MKSKFAAIAVMAFVLTGCAAAEPEAPAAPQPLMGSTTATAEPTAEPTASATAEPDDTSSDYPGSDENAFLTLVHRDWQDENALPADEVLIQLGYGHCNPDTGHTGEFAPTNEEWLQSNDLLIYVAAAYHLCPAP